MYCEWNPKLMEVFSPKELIVLENVIMYLNYENNIAYQDSMYETFRDNGEESEHSDYVPGEDREVQEYEVFHSIYKKLMIHHETDEIPENIFTEAKYSCNVSNQFRQSIGG
jgi:hypothetical protein